MKTVNSKTKYQLQSELIDDAIDKFGVNDLFNVLMDRLSYKQKQEIKERVKSEYLDDFRFDDKCDGFIVFKVDSLEKREKVETFLCNEIFPYYNEQQSQLFN